ncbi:unnamed protein product [Pleuronectes platessa]|uniref:Uncharacterized protein n=1 Tax=Pleuronectes platessa TaxID=8262 RepID=A0A9N7YAW5_PLEPL|nr:unnamed protein product [Pleuronectes platessa]
MCPCGFDVGPQVPVAWGPTGGLVPRVQTPLSLMAPPPRRPEAAAFKHLGAAEQNARPSMHHSTSAGSHSTPQMVEMFLSIRSVRRAQVLFLLSSVYTRNSIPLVLFQSILLFAPEHLQHEGSGTLNC